MSGDLNVKNNERARLSSTLINAFKREKNILLKQIISPQKNHRNTLNTNSLKININHTLDKSNSPKKINSSNLNNVFNFEFQTTFYNGSSKSILNSKKDLKINFKKKLNKKQKIYDEKKAFDRVFSVKTLKNKNSSRNIIEPIKYSSKNKINEKNHNQERFRSIKNEICFGKSKMENLLRNLKKEQNMSNNILQKFITNLKINKIKREKGLIE